MAFVSSRPAEGQAGEAGTRWSTSSLRGSAAKTFSIRSTVASGRLGVHVVTSGDARAAAPTRRLGGHVDREHLGAGAEGSGVHDDPELLRGAGADLERLRDVTGRHAPRFEPGDDQVLVLGSVCDVVETLVIVTVSVSLLSSWLSSSCSAHGQV